MANLSTQWEYSTFHLPSTLRAVQVYKTLDATSCQTKSSLRDSLVLSSPKSSTFGILLLIVGRDFAFLSWFIFHISSQDGCDPMTYRTESVALHWATWHLIHSLSWISKDIFNSLRCALPLLHSLLKDRIQDTSYISVCQTYCVVLQDYLVSPSRGEATSFHLLNWNLAFTCAGLRQNFYTLSNSRLIGWVWSCGSLPDF